MPDLLPMRSVGMRIGVRGSFWKAEPESTDPRAVIVGAFFKIVTHIPERQVIGRVDTAVSIIFPPKAIGLRRLARRENSLFVAHDAEAIPSQPPRPALTRVLVRPAKGIADTNVAVFIRRGACHPSVFAIRRKGALLV